MAVDTKSLPHQFANNIIINTDKLVKNPKTVPKPPKSKNISSTILNKL